MTGRGEWMVGDRVAYGDALGVVSRRADDGATLVAFDHGQTLWLAPGSLTAPAEPDAGRPGGWVAGIGWVARVCDMPKSTKIRWDSEDGITTGIAPPSDDIAIVVAWPDGIEPAPPSSPVARTEGGAIDTGALRDLAQVYFASVGEWAYDLATAAADELDRRRSAWSALAAVIEDDLRDEDGAATDDVWHRHVGKAAIALVRAAPVASGKADTPTCLCYPDPRDHEPTCPFASPVAAAFAEIERRASGTAPEGDERLAEAARLLRLAIAPGASWDESRRAWLASEPVRVWRCACSDHRSCGPDNPCHDDHGCGWAAPVGGPASTDATGDE